MYMVGAGEAGEGLVSIPRKRPGLDRARMAFERMGAPCMKTVWVQGERQMATPVSREAVGEMYPKLW